MSSSNNIDEQIRAALENDRPTDLLTGFDEQSLFVQAMQIFRGRNRWINSIMVVCSLACLLLSGYAAYRFYWAIEIKELIACSVAFSTGILAVSMMKIWAWLEMEKYSTIREIKRLELQIVALKSKAPIQ